ncbi:uncharacterized protein [Aegilops tauschii subsp. strangulata]|uniref:uncharacterized protein n=1 Tax=Aegilops tauschii subsp. strangulata TaxID=200361 RepID=UPI003CC856FD
MDNPPRTLLQLPDSFTEELVADAPLGLWLQLDSCCKESSWVAAEFTPSGYMCLTRGWKLFAHAYGVKEGHTLHFKFDGAATLFVKIFRAAGDRLECCMESDSSIRSHSYGYDISDGGSASFGGSGVTG